MMATSATVNMITVGATIGGTSNALAWGIYTSSNQPFFAPSGASSSLSTFSFEFVRANQVSDFPVEANSQGTGASFASFNKVWKPATPFVTLALSGSAADKSAFLALLEAASVSTDVYNIHTPDATYIGYTIERYSFRRTAERGATMLLVEIALKEIKTITPAYASRPVISPASASAAPSVNNGMVQTTTPAANFSNWVNTHPLLFNECNKPPYRVN